MAQPTGTFASNDSGVNAEDVSDIAYMLTPSDTPFQTLVKRGKAEATLTEWVIDSLAAVDGANAVIEGDDATADTLTNGSRAVNYVQTSDKVAIVTTIQDVVKKYGHDSEFAYQKMKKLKELKRNHYCALAA